MADLDLDAIKATLRRHASASARLTDRSITDSFPLVTYGEVAGLVAAVESLRAEVAQLKQRVAFLTVALAWEGRTVTWADNNALHLSPRNWDGDND